VPEQRFKCYINYIEVNQQENRMYNLIDVYLKTTLGKWVWVDSTRMHKTCVAAKQHYVESLPMCADKVKCKKA
jgi:hypothetical protein